MSPVTMLLVCTAMPLARCQRGMPTILSNSPCYSGYWMAPGGTRPHHDWTVNVEKAGTIDASLWPWEPPCHHGSSQWDGVAAHDLHLRPMGLTMEDKIGYSRTGWVHSLIFLGRVKMEESSYELWVGVGLSSLAGLLHRGAQPAVAGAKLQHTIGVRRPR